MYPKGKRIKRYNSQTNNSKDKDNYSINNNYVRANDTQINLSNKLVLEI